ncbi:MAG: tRNA (adenosine(37)-N6)-threonylcarbamoyltransferase complex dimerization subunit type 1 TsaB, partial [Sphingobacteriales bacterium]
MPLILSIDTSLEEASICIAEGERVIDMKKNLRQTDHAAWIQTAIGDTLRDAGKTMRDLSAVAVTAGPGSYT